MIRPTLPDDSAALIALTVAAGLFPANETQVLSSLPSYERTRSFYAKCAYEAGEEMETSWDEVS